MKRFSPPNSPCALQIAPVTLRRWQRLVLACCLVLGAGVGVSRAQTPVVTTLNSYTGKPGDTVTITGANFSPAASDNVVSFGATHGTVLSASAGQLQVQVPAGATYAPVTVRVASGKSAASARPFVPVFAPTGPVTSSSFAQSGTSGNLGPVHPYVNIFTNAGTTTVGAIVDLDGDGKPDLAVAEAGTYSMRILRNVATTGSLTATSFTTALDLATGQSSGGNYTPADVAFGDLNGDGKPDLVVANSAGGGTASAVTILQNTSTPGTISFLAAFNLPLPTGSYNLPKSVKIIDVDGDGWPDIVCGGNQILVYRNKGLGGTLSAASFESGVVYNAASASSSSNLAVADMDGDGKPDLIVPGSGTQCYVLRNTSTPGVIDANSFAVVTLTTPQPTAVAVVDVNGDGKPDLIVGSFGSLSIFPNQATPGSLTADSFGTRVDVTLPNSALVCGMSVADFNGDGWPDIAVTDIFGPGVILVVNSGSGNVATAFNTLVGLTLPTGAGYSYDNTQGHVALADLNGNGQPDLLVDGPSGSIVLSENFVSPLTVTSLSSNSNIKAVKLPWFRTAIFSATETFSDNSTLDVTNAAAWSSSLPQVATINAAGVATGVSLGTATIQAAASGLTAQAPLPVQPIVFGQNPGNPDGGFLPVVANGGNSGAVDALAVQADGKVVIGGAFSTVNGVARNNLARINDDGSLDTTFDPGTGPDSDVRALALDATGRVVIGGLFATVNGTARRGAARLQANGTLDTTFNANITSTNPVNAIGIRPDGRLLFGGLNLSTGGVSTSAPLLQVSESGARDTAFAGDVASASGTLDALALQPDGSVLISGKFSNTALGTFDVARALSSGAFDPNFQNSITSGEVGCLALQPDGKIVVGGNFKAPADSSLQYLTRLNADGSLDSGFVVRKGTFSTAVLAVALQKNGKVLASHLLNTVRLTATGSVDSTYDKTVYPDWNIDVLAVGANEKVWEAGGNGTTNGAPTMGVARLQGDVSSFLGWQSRYFTQAQLTNDPVHTGANGDVVGDGVPNLIKYALGVNATQSGVGVLPTTSSAAANAANPGTGDDFTFRQRLLATDLLYQVGVSYDLMNWDYSGGGLSAVGTPTANADGLTQNVTLRLGTPVSGEGGRVFFRLRASLQP